MKEHNQYYSERNRENCFKKKSASHKYEEHQEKKVMFRGKVFGNMFGKASRCMIREAVYIDNFMIADSMNEHMGWSHVLF